MCTHRRYITNPYTYRRLVVDCGVCPACQQAKAIARTNRIRNHYDDVHKNCMVLFCTFTYRNSCVPYFKRSELALTGSIIVRRDSTVRVVKKKNGVYGRKTTHVPDVLCELPLEFIPSDDFKPLVKSRKNGVVKYDSDRVSVVYNKDFQDFIKRLRINLQRKYLYEESLQYFYCSEYGPTTGRAHFHALFFVPFGQYSLFKRAIAQSWSFDDYKQCLRNIQIAKNVAGYVSSYVNCSSSVPSLFRCFKETRMAHHYSQNFGLGKECLSFDKVLECYRKRDLHIDMPRFRDKALVIDRVLFPKYALHRYFPKWKGYRCLTTDEIKSIYERPSEIYHYVARCDLDSSQAHRIRVMLEHKLQFAESHGLSSSDYAIVASSVHTIYASNVMADFYNDLSNPINNLYAYDNISEIDKFNQPYFAEFIDVLSDRTPIYLYGLNEFPQLIAKTRNLENCYNSYSKDRKVRNHIYSNYLNI